jgi:hypothetical protein
LRGGGPFLVLLVDGFGGGGLLDLLASTTFAKIGDIVMMSSSGLEIRPQAAGRSARRR